MTRKDDDFFEKWSNIPIKFAPNDVANLMSEEKSKSSTPQLLVALSVIVVLVAVVTVLVLKLS